MALDAAHRHGIVHVARPLFQTRVPFVGNPFRTSYEVSADGRRFLVNTVLDGCVSPPITVVLNWMSGLQPKREPD